MSFPRQNPVGWNNNEPITPTQINGIDENLSRALDGTAGGIYTPSTTLTIKGQGLTVDDATLKFLAGGVLNLGPSFIVPDANSTLRPSDGIIQRMTTPTAARTHTMAAGEAEGNIIVLVRPVTGAFAITIQNTGAINIVVLSSATHAACILYRDSTKWRLGPFSAGCIADTDA